MQDLRYFKSHPRAKAMMEGLEQRLLFAIGSGADILLDPSPLPGLSTFPFPSEGRPDLLLPGPNGSLWVTAGNNLGIVAPDGAVTTFPSPILSGNGNPALGRGYLWLADELATANEGKVYRIDAMGNYTSFKVPGVVAALSTGPDNGMWFISGPDSGTMTTLGDIRFDGTVATFPLDKSLSRVSDLVFGPGDSFWAAETSSASIARITPAASVNEFSVAPPAYPNSDPTHLAVGPDGNVWFTEPTGALVGKITPQGQVSRYSIPADPTTITPGPDGAMWLAEPNHAAIGRLTTDGKYSEYPSNPNLLLGLDAQPLGIATGSDGNIWFTSQSADGNLVARLNVKTDVARVTPLDLPRQSGAFNGVVATITDPSGRRTASDFSVTIHWGDHYDSAGQVNPLPGGGFIISGAHNYARGGSLPLSIDVKAALDLPVTAYTTIAVGDYPLADAKGIPVFLTAGDMASELRVLTFTDTDPNGAPDQFTALINWGDGQQVWGTITRGSAPGSFVVSGSHAYATTGSYPVYVDVRDIGDNVVYAQTTATVVHPAVFIPQPDIKLAEPSMAAAAGDVTRHGLDDLLVASHDTLSVFPAAGGLIGATGTLANPVVSTFPGLGIDPVALVPADFNLDGNLDAFYLSPTPTPGRLKAGVLLGNGFDATFRAGPAQVVLGTPVSSNQIATADLNGDGVPDVAIPGNSDRVTILLGSKDGTMRPIALPVEGQPYAVAAADFNQDGKPDLAVSYRSSVTGAAAVAIFMGRGDSTFLSPISYSVPSTFPPDALLAGDINEDHAIDLVAVDSASVAFFSMANHGGGTFTPSSINPLEFTAPSNTGTAGEPASVTGACLADVSADDRLDLVFTDPADNSLRVRLGRGDGTFLPDTRFALDSRPANLVVGRFRTNFRDLAVISNSGEPAPGAVQLVLDSNYRLTPLAATVTEGSGQPINLLRVDDDFARGFPGFYSIDIDWGNGMHSLGVRMPQNGFDIVSGLNPYKSAGTYTATVTVLDGGKILGVRQVPVVVADASLSVDPFSFSAFVNTPFTAQLATFNDPNPFSAVSDFTVTIDWGDGTVSAGTILRQAGGPYMVLGTHSYLAASTSSYRASVTIKDIGGASTTVKDALVVHSSGGGSISGNVFEDLNADGLRQLNDPPLVGWTVYVDRNKNGKPDPFEISALSSATGQYTLANLPADALPIRLLVPSGWRSTGPASGAQTVIVTAGQIVNGVDFGAVHFPPTVVPAFPYPQIVTFTFSEPVSITASAVSVMNLDSGTNLVPSSSTYDPNSNTLTLTWQPPLPDGNYRAVVSAAAITDSAGQHLNGTSDHPDGSDVVFDFFTLTGDFNHDRKVNFSDLLILAQHYGHSGKLGDGDSNGDGQVGFADLLTLSQHYGASLPQPQTALSALNIPDIHRRRHMPGRLRIGAS